MKKAKKQKKSKKIIYTTLGTVIIGITGIFCVLLNSTKLENLTLRSKVSKQEGLEVTNADTNFFTNFDYTNNITTYKANYQGKYKLEVWGAQGGTTQGYTGGYGGYSYGEITLNKDDALYVVVGGAGIGATRTGQSMAGGYNGGGSVAGNSAVNHFTGSRRRSNTYRKNHRTIS